MWVATSLQGKIYLLNDGFNFRKSTSTLKGQICLTRARFNYIPNTNKFPTSYWNAKEI
jgi:hypothetical protein